MSREAIDELKRQVPLLEYLQADGWRPARQLNRSRCMGLCPLHPDRKPSFLVDSGKGLFYCYGCGRGGDVIRFVELSRNIRFPEAVSLLHQSRGVSSLLDATARFYQDQLHGTDEAVAYLRQCEIHSPEIIRHMRIGYAPGGCLRSWLTQLGHPIDALRRAGLITAAGCDAWLGRIVFPLENNLYGRSISAAAESAASELFAQDPVLLAQIVNRLLPLLIHPARDRDHHEPDPIENAHRSTLSRQFRKVGHLHCFSARSSFWTLHDRHAKACPRDPHHPGAVPRPSIQDWSLIHISRLRGNRSTHTDPFCNSLTRTRGEWSSRQRGAI